MADRKTLLTRIVLGAIMIAAVVGVLVLDAYLYMPESDSKGQVVGCVVILLAVLAFRELGKLARAAGAGLLTCSGLLGVIVLGTIPVWGQFFPFLLLDDVWFLLGGLVLLTFLEQMIRHRAERAIERIAATFLAVLYLGVGAAVMLTIRMEWGLPALALFLAAVKSADIGAYFVGTAIGRHKLIPWLSPGKSWEGLAGGLVVAAGASVLVVWLFGLCPELAIGLSPKRAAVFGVGVGLAGQFADLCESLLKRSAQVKDSGAAVPAFGGVLDILDSPLLAAPVAYLLLEILL
ncbi:MAG TPA: phosphatidate cytidylyltransferase [Phycisphaerae bacterium]|nr:phosphatidate cytidylyltransferase [Phycisphaerae bacterium]